MVVAISFQGDVIFILLGFVEIIFYCIGKTLALVSKMILVRPKKHYFCSFYVLEKDLI